LASDSGLGGGMSKRSHDIMVRLDDREVAVLDEHRGSPRATYLRRLLHEPPKEQEVASRAEAMAILTRLARDGKTQAACVLARELREGGEADLMSWILDAP
jgi:hypothetical protein